MARNRRTIALSVIAAGLIVGVLFFKVSPSSSDQASTNPYQALPVDAGLYNKGQASFWDLPFLDYFIIFGAPERARGWRPEQPIKFSHVRHVQQSKMECQYCHWSVAKAAFAALPEAESCMGCHKIIMGGSEYNKSVQTDADKAALAQAQAEVKKLAKFYSEGTPIPWQKVHVMPDFVKFNHKRHIKAGMGCQECHGQIPEMPVVQRASSMKMGWCVGCHRERGTSIDCTTCHK